MAEEAGEKTHEATPHRRQEALEQGQVVRSQELGSAVLLIVALGVLLYQGQEIAKFATRLMREALSAEATFTMDQETLASQWRAVLGEMGWVLLPLLGALLLTAIGVNLAQVGFLFLPKKAGFDPSNVNPIKGLGRIFSTANLVRLVLGLAKIGVITGVAVWCLWGKQNEIIGLAALEVPQIASYVTLTLLWTAMKIAAAVLLIALIDYVYQRLKHEKDLMMTTEEVKEEMKNLQGDPQVIARRRTVQRQLVMNRMKSQVPQADVVVTNPTELAIAIKYDYETMPAPVVVAKGAGVLAQRIRRLALENSIPIVERKALAQTLYKHVEIGQQVPTEEYAAVAEVLRYVYQLQGKTVPGSSGS